MAEFNILSEIRASVWQVEVAVGDSVTAGQDLIILESMKTEIPVTAPRGGTVSAILVAEGDSVDERQPLITLVD